MGAISSEIVHLLKVKCPYKITRDGFCCFLGYQNFLGEDPQTPLQIRKYFMWFIFQLNTVQHMPLVKSEIFN